MRHTALLALVSILSLSSVAPAVAPSSRGSKYDWAHQPTWGPSDPLGQDRTPSMLWLLLLLPLPSSWLCPSFLQAVTPAEIRHGTNLAG